MPRDKDRDLFGNEEIKCHVVDREEMNVGVGVL